MRLRVYCGKYISQMKIATQKGNIYREFMQRSEKRHDEIAEAVNEIKNEVEEVNEETKKSGVRVENFWSLQNYLSKAQKRQTTKM